MNHIIKKISRAVQLVLLAPVKLPGKALHIVKYIALGLGILESVLDEPEEKKPEKGERREEHEDAE